VESIRLAQNLQSFRLGSGWIVLLLAGNATLSAGYRGASSRVLRAPALVILPGKRSGRAEIRGMNLALELDSCLWDEVAEDFRGRGILLPRESEGLKLEPADAEYLGAIMQRLTTENDESSLHIEEWFCNSARHLLLFAHRRINSSPEDRMVWNIGDAVSFIETHIDQQFALEDFAERCAMNHSSFSREFKAATGYTLFEYINRVKIRHACSMLKHSGRSVMDIAMDLGYNNISHFNRYFRRVTGQTPSDFRKLR
jgi:AraC-like DNA-binding protein